MKAGSNPCFCIFRRSHGEEQKAEETLRELGKTEPAFWWISFGEPCAAYSGKFK